MQNTLTIAGRQFRSYFNGPAAYIVTSLFLVLLGAFFWTPFFLMGRASIRDMFQVVPILLLVAAPAITMGLIADEKKSGTIELLITMPVKDAEVVLGKYLGAFALYAIMLVMTLSYPMTVSKLGNLDWGQVWTGYFGLLLEGGAMLAIGIAASSFTDNSLIALFGAASTCFAFWIIDRFLPFMPAGAASAIEWMSFDYHFRSMARGVIDLRDVLYFGSITGFSLGVAFWSLSSRRWK